MYNVIDEETLRVKVRDDSNKLSWYSHEAFAINEYVMVEEETTGKNSLPSSPQAIADALSKAKAKVSELEAALLKANTKPVSKNVVQLKLQETNSDSEQLNAACRVFCEALGLHSYAMEVRSGGMYQNRGLYLCPSLANWKIVNDVDSGGSGQTLPVLVITYK